MKEKDIYKVKTAHDILKKVLSGELEENGTNEAAEYKAPSFNFIQSTDYEPKYYDTQKSTVATFAVHTEPMKFVYNSLKDLGTAPSQSDIFVKLFKNTVQNDLPIYTDKNGVETKYSTLLKGLEDSLDFFAEGIPYDNLKKADIIIDAVAAALRELYDDFCNSDTCDAVEKYLEEHLGERTLSAEEYKRFKKVNAVDKYLIFEKAKLTCPDIPQQIYESCDDGEFMGLRPDAIEDFSLLTIIGMDINEKGEIIDDPFGRFLVEHPERIYKHYLADPRSEILKKMPDKKSSDGASDRELGMELIKHFMDLLRGVLAYIYTRIDKMKKIMYNDYLNDIAVKLVRCRMPVPFAENYGAALSEYSRRLTDDGEISLKRAEYLYIKNVVCGINGDDVPVKTSVKLSFSDFCRMNYILSKEGADAFRFLLINADLLGVMSTNANEDSFITRYLKMFTKPFDSETVSNIEQTYRDRIFYEMAGKEREKNGDKK